MISHQESGQSGIHMNLLEGGVYESTALLDGNYTVRIIKRGYQEIEQSIEDMIRNHPGTRSADDVQWSQGTELLFAFASMAVMVIVVVAMALWFNLRS